ncbi:uncharacterized protein LOC105828256 [Monomorium pharaonis]|uniref:uncharacterized protein LOC105828256 n=1 Tax=Monomorium pharaonis TaxID=307658 RepID=UPI001745F159|nr:uncharacterized protein LOC105828256 [Monomorium pharaonis]
MNNTLAEGKLTYIDIVTAMVKILYQCRPKEPELTLLLGGDYNEFLRRAFFSWVPVALIGETSPRFNALEKIALTRYSFKTFVSYNFIPFLRKSHRFVLVASSQPLLRSILQRTKDSPWANSDGFYIIVDKETETRGCINARSFLWTAWEFDLLSVIFPCIDPDNGIVYYTYNPYSNSTPDNWVEVDRAKGRHGHPWIILRKKYEKDEDKVCKNLDFDKLTTLEGYEIRLNAVEMAPFIKVNLSAPDMTKFRGDNSEILKMLLFKLGASLSIDLYNGSIYGLGGIGPNGTLEGLMAPVSDGRIDIGMNTRTLLALWKVKYVYACVYAHTYTHTHIYIKYLIGNIIILFFRYTYPHTRSGLCVIAQPRQEVSQFTKLIKFLSPEVIAGVVIICLLTYTIFTKNEGYLKASLQVLRLMVCVGILHPPKVSSTRIFLCMTLILFLNINALFQSHLSALLTVPVYYRNIDTLENIKKSGYTIYGPEQLRKRLNDPVLESRYVTVTYEECKEFVENSTTAACFGDCYHLYYRIKGQDLIRSNQLIEMTQSYVTREDWPLYARVDNIIQQMSQVGLIIKSRSEFYWEIKREKYINSMKKKGFKVMLLKQLAFSFYFLTLGYVCATIVFILELVVGRSAPKSRNQIRIKKSMKLKKRNKKFE